MGKKRILILDDEKEICFLLSALLSQMGYTTDYAYTLQEGKNKFEEEQFDLVFLDLNLPDGLGYNLVPKIRELNHDTKIVMISAHDALLKKIQAEKEGIDYYIDKPFNKEKINIALASINFASGGS